MNFVSTHLGNNMLVQQSTSILIPGNMVGYIIFTATISLAWICISYKDFALKSGWPIGTILNNDTSLPKLMSIVALLWALVKSVLVYNWYSFLIVGILGFFIAFTLTSLFKKNVQFLGVIGIFPMWFLTIIYNSEEAPFGFFHNLL